MQSPPERRQVTVGYSKLGPSIFRSRVGRFCGSFFLLIGLLYEVGPASTGSAESNTQTNHTACPHGFTPGTFASNICLDGYLINDLSATFGVPDHQNLTSGAGGDYIREKVSAYTFSPCDKGWIETGYEWDDASGSNPYMYYAFKTFQGSFTEVETPNTYPVNGYGGIAWNSSIGWNTQVYSGLTGFFSPSETLGVAANASGPACIEEAGDFINANSGTLAHTKDYNKVYSSLFAKDTGGTIHSSWPYYSYDNPCGLNGNSSGDCMDAAFLNNNTEWEANDDGLP